MAKELNLAASLRFEKNGIEAVSSFANRLDVAGTKYVKLSQTVGTSEEAINLGDLGTAGLIMAVNRDATNFVSIRPATGVADLIKIRAGSFALFEIANVVLDISGLTISVPNATTLSIDDTSGFTVGDTVRITQAAVSRHVSVASIIADTSITVTGESLVPAASVAEISIAAAPFIIADTAACLVEFLIIEQ